MNTSDTADLPQQTQTIILRPDWRFMLRHPAHILAQGFGSGLSPAVPGTMGTLFGWLSFNVLSQRWPDIFTTAGWAWIIVVGFLIGIWACKVTGKILASPIMAAWCGMKSLPSGRCCCLCCRQMRARKPGHFCFSAFLIWLNRHRSAISIAT